MASIARKFIKEKIELALFTFPDANTDGVVRMVTQALVSATVRPKPTLERVCGQCANGAFTATLPWNRVV